MKVEIKVLPEAKEPYAVIYASEITPEIRRTAALLETKNSGVVSVMENERIIVLRPDEIYMVRMENEKTVVYTKTKRHDGGKRLYEFEEILGKGFMRISKGTLANLHYLDYVESTLGGLMLLVLKNGCKECISRKYLPAFKQYLGLYGGVCGEETIEKTLFRHRHGLLRLRCNAIHCSDFRGRCKCLFRGENGRRMAADRALLHPHIRRLLYSVSDL